MCGFLNAVRSLAGTFSLFGGGSDVKQMMNMEKYIMFANMVDQ